MLKPPPTRYAHSGEAMIAYQVVGEGPVDLIVVGGPASHLDLEWEEPSIARAFEHYASFCRLVRFDRRGTGLSDPVDDVPTLEQQMDDLEAVMDAAGIERAALSGTADAGLAPMYAATHPDRVSARVCALAAAGEVLVSSTVRELVVGSELSFADRGGHALRGVPGEWRLYAVEVP
jgi:pimeloyl-ACP methyl ester carboxylesterase